MNESIHIPSGRIARYVKFIWCSENYDPESPKERVLPTGSSQLIINLENKAFRHFSEDKSQEYLYDPVIVAGIQSGPVFLDSYSRISTMGVVLRPGAIAAFLRLPAQKFQDQVISLEAILKRDISELREQLVAAATHQEKFVLLETFLSSLLDPEYQLHPAVDFAISQIDLANGSIPIAKIHNKIGYSRRWFSQIFRDTAGITPKHFSRILRFQHTLNLIREINKPDWSQFAISNGYFDQSHFINDFKDLAGISPSMYKNHAGEAANHLFI